MATYGSIEPVGDALLRPLHWPWPFRICPCMRPWIKLVDHRHLQFVRAVVAMQGSTIMWVGVWNVVSYYQSKVGMVTAETTQQTTEHWETGVGVAVAYIVAGLVSSHLLGNFYGQSGLGGLPKFFPRAADKESCSWYGLCSHPATSFARWLLGMWTCALTFVGWFTLIGLLGSELNRAGESVALSPSGANAMSRTEQHERDVRRAMVSGGMVAIGIVVLLVTRTYHHFSFVFPGGDTWFWDDRNGAYLWGPELIWPHNSIAVHARALLRATLALVAQNLLWVGVYDVCERQFSVLRARTVCDPPRSLAPLHGSCAFVLDPRTGKAELYSSLGEEGRMLQQFVYMFLGLFVMAMGDSIEINAWLDTTEIGAPVPAEDESSDSDFDCDSADGDGSGGGSGGGDDGNVVTAPRCGEDGADGAERSARCSAAAWQHIAKDCVTWPVRRTLAPKWGLKDNLRVWFRSTCSIFGQLIHITGAWTVYDEYMFGSAAHAVTVKRSRLSNVAWIVTGALIGYVAGGTHSLMANFGLTNLSELEDLESSSDDDGENSEAEDEESGGNGAELVESVSGDGDDDADEDDDDEEEEEEEEEENKEVE